MNTCKYLNNLTFGATGDFAREMAEVRTKLYKSGVCWTDSVQGRFAADTPFRVILSTNGKHADFKNPMVRECNGLVVEYRRGGWHLLSMPPYAFCSSKISMKKLADLQDAGNFDLYEALDATILTLYYYEGQWRLSSKKCFDISDMEMIRGMTYMEAFQDLMHKKYRSFAFDQLSPSCSYTIALRHSAHHIFDETKHLSSRTKNAPRPGVDMNSYLMVSCVSDLASMQYTPNHVPGLPYQHPIAKKFNIATLDTYAKSAYAKYAKADKLQSFKYKPLYGYVLRARNRSVPVEYSAILIESDLYRLIKTGLYKYNNDVQEGDYDQIAVRMAMDYDNYERFYVAFPQFRERFQKLHDVIDYIAETTTECVKTEGVAEVANCGVKANPQLAVSIIQDLTARFKEESDISPDLVRDFMYSRGFMTVLPKLIGA